MPLLIDVIYFAELFARFNALLAVFLSTPVRRP